MLRLIHGKGDHEGRPGPSVRAYGRQPAPWQGTAVPCTPALQSLLLQEVLMEEPLEDYRHFAQFAATQERNA